MLKCLFTFGIMLVLSTSAHAGDKCISSVIPHAQIVGEGHKKDMIFHLYDAKLYAERGIYDPLKPFALTVTYRIGLDGEDISNEAARQIQQLGMTDNETLTAWHAAMAGIFPDVKEGDVLTGLRLKNGHTLFCMSGREIGRIEDKSFGNYFFGIWLDQDAEDQGLRRKLMEKS